VVKILSDRGHKEVRVFCKTRSQNGPVACYFCT
jgi:hypothetical protein